MDKITINIYWQPDKDKNKVLDIENMTNDFNEAINNLIRSGEYISSDKANF